MLYYCWQNYFDKTWHKTRCELINRNEKTATIKLLEFGKDNRPPGTVIRVQIKSLEGLEKTPEEIEKETSSWRNRFPD